MGPSREIKELLLKY